MARRAEHVAHFRVLPVCDSIGNLSCRAANSIHSVSYYGTSPRFLLELEIARVNPRQEFDLASLRMVNVTGASLAHTQYHWFYSHFPSRIHLCNVAGGTDTATSLLAGDPCGPLVPGEMQIFGKYCHFLVRIPHQTKKLHRARYGY